MNTNGIQASAASTFIHLGMVMGIVLVFTAMLFLPAIAHNSDAPIQQDANAAPMRADS